MHGRIIYMKSQKRNNLICGSCDEEFENSGQLRYHECRDDKV